MGELRSLWIVAGCFAALALTGALIEALISGTALDEAVVGISLFPLALLLPFVPVHLLVRSRVAQMESRRRLTAAVIFGTVIPFGAVALYEAAGSAWVAGLLVIVGGVCGGLCDQANRDGPIYTASKATAGAWLFLLLVCGASLALRGGAP